MIEPLRLSLEGDCDAEHAFAMSTALTSRRSPNGHPVSREPRLVVFEPHVGGRIFERTRSGREVDWGEVLVREPPPGLVCLWHINADRSDACAQEELVVAASGLPA